MIFVDMDGVVADFDTHHENHFGNRPTRWPDKDGVDWDKVRATPNYFGTIPMMPDAELLIRTLGDRPFKMLTGVPKEVDTSSNEKIDWIRQNIDPIAGRTVDVICCRSRDKCKHGQPGDVLIDDYLKYRHLWVGMGGIFIHHTSAGASLNALGRVEREMA